MMMMMSAMSRKITRHKRKKKEYEKAKPVSRPKVLWMASIIVASAALVSTPFQAIHSPLPPLTSWCVCWPAYLPAYLDLDSEQLSIHNRLLAKPVFSAVSRIYIFYFAIYSLRDWDIFSYFVKVYVEKKLKSRQFHRFHFVTCSIALCCVYNFLFSGFGIRCSTPKRSPLTGAIVSLFLCFFLS